MMRLFVAVDPGPAIRNSISDVMAGLRCDNGPIRWVSPDAMHVTLKFLGAVPAEKVGSISGAIDAAAGNHRAFELAMDGFGTFPTGRRPRVLWAACQPSPALELLQHEIVVGLEKIGFEAEGKPFRPHVTVGRVRRKFAISDLTQIVEELTASELCAAGYVDSVNLMSSTLSPGGAVYAGIHTSPLRVE